MWISIIDLIPERGNTKVKLRDGTILEVYCNGSRFYNLENDKRVDNIVSWYMVVP